MMRVIGIDVSLSACGLCVLPDNWAAGSRDWSEVHVDTVGMKLSKDASEQERAERLDRLTALVSRFATLHDADTAVFEQYAFSAAGQYGARAIAELGGCLRMSLHRLSMRVTVVPASSARKVLLGSVPAGRGQAKAAVQRFLRDMGAPFWKDDNRCDAFCVANWALAEQGFAFVGRAA